MHCHEKHRLQRELLVQWLHKKVVSSETVVGLIPVPVGALA